MIPFTPAPAIHILGWTVPAFSILMVAGILVGRTILMRRARRFGMDHSEIAPLYLCMLIAGLAGAFVAQWILTGSGMTLMRGPGLASIGGLVGGLAAGVVMLAARRYSLARALLLLDITAFAVPFASCVARLGCALAHDHRGLPSNSWLAVAFPEGPRWDLGLLEVIFLAALAGLFLLLDRKPRRTGFFFGLAGMLYGTFRIWRESLDVRPHFAPWLVVVISAAVLWILTSGRRHRSGKTELGNASREQRHYGLIADSGSAQA